MADYVTKSLSNSFLPGDLMIEILCRLSVKYLTRFKTVSKSWYFVIKNRWFIRMHFDHVSKLENESFILIQSNSLESELGVIRPGSNKWESLYGIKEPGEYEIVGASKGLICLTRLDYRFGSYFTLRNPALAQSKLITCITTINPLFVSVGFGFDQQGDDFKIVKLELLQGIPDGFEHSSQFRFLRVHVYSVHANSWKFFEILTSLTIRDKFPIATLESCIYWPATNNVGRECRLAVFNLSTETFHVSSPFPGGCSEIVALRQESLALLFYGNDKAGDVWTINQDGDIVKQVDRSWLRKHPYSAENYLRFLREHYGKVMSSRRNGDFLVRNRQNLLLFTRKENELRLQLQIIEHLPKSRHVLQTPCFRESLFSLN